MNARITTDRENFHVRCKKHNFKKGVDKTAETVKDAGSKAIDKTKEAATAAGEKVKEAGQKIKDAGK